MKCFVGSNMHFPVKNISAKLFCRTLVINSGRREHSKTRNQTKKPKKCLTFKNNKMERVVERGQGRGRESCVTTSYQLSDITDFSLFLFFLEETLADFGKSIFLLPCSWSPLKHLPRRCFSVPCTPLPASRAMSPPLPHTSPSQLHQPLSVPLKPQLFLKSIDFGNLVLLMDRDHTRAQLLAPRSPKLKGYLTREYWHLPALCRKSKEKCI